MPRREPGSSSCSQTSNHEFRGVTRTPQRQTPDSVSESTGFARRAVSAEPSSSNSKLVNLVRLRRIRCQEGHKRITTNQSSVLRYVSETSRPGGAEFEQLLAEVQRSDSRGGLTPQLFRHQVPGPSCYVSETSAIPQATTTAPARRVLPTGSARKRPARSAVTTTLVSRTAATGAAAARCRASSTRQ